MKNKLLLFLALIITNLIISQTPEKLNYQAVLRSSDNTLLSNTAIGMQVSIIEGSISGTAIYVETHAVSTSAEGLVSVAIGTGTVVSGDFTTIDWSSGPYFIKVETDPEGGSSYSLETTTELMSVPYALHAKTAETVENVTLSEVSGGALDIQNGVMVLTNMTTAERDALSSVSSGMLIFNTDEKQLQVASTILQEGSDLIGGGNINDSDVSKYGQTFSPSGSDVITEISLNSETSRTVTLNIYEGSGNSGTLLYSDSQTVGVGVNTFVLSTPLNVTGGDVYTIQFDGCECRFTASNPYANGQIIEMANPTATGFDVYDLYCVVKYQSGFSSWLGL